MKFALLLLASVLATLVWAPDAPAQKSSVSEPTSQGLLPPGPHIILTVPLVLRSMPPEVNQYEVVCFVEGAPGSSAQRGTGKILGKGVATGPIAGTSQKSPDAFTKDVEVEVDVTPATAETLQSVESYQCELFLDGVANGFTVRYLGDGRTTMPLAAGVHPKRLIRGPMPKTTSGG
jgi:hypothetical protein